MKPIWVELVDKGVANRFEFEDHELIEMNWRLTLYPKLYYTVYQHEINHCNGRYEAKDLLHDMTSRTPGLFKFMSNHISTWIQVLPIYWDRRRGQLVYDWSATISWGMIFGTGIGMFYFMRWLL